MSQAKPHEDNNLYLEDGFWKLRQGKAAMNASGLETDQGSEDEGSERNATRDPVWVGMATGPKGLTEEEAQQTVWKILMLQLRHNEIEQQSSMTLAEFVERKFVPGYVAHKGLYGRMHYQAMLKHVLTPEEVDRVFGVETEKSKAKLKTVADWPYLSNVPLRDVGTECVQRILSAALNRGYSIQTVTHIRNVLSTIFSYAKQERCFAGDNPASLVRLPAMNRKNVPAITAADVTRILKSMKYPEKEMTLIAILTGMTVAEICGLQWKRVNLTDKAVLNKDDESIPPKSIAVREEYLRGEMCSVTNSRKGDLQIPEHLILILLRLSHRAEFIGPDDFVLVSRVGTPINQINILARRLKPIGKELQIPWLSWRGIRRLHKALLKEFGTQFHNQITALVEAEFSLELSSRENWRSSAEPELPY